MRSTSMKTRFQLNHRRRSYENSVQEKNPVLSRRRTMARKSGTEPEQTSSLLNATDWILHWRIRHDSLTRVTKVCGVARRLSRTTIITPSLYGS
ncbi:hypothetical protein WN55_01177 [Dufourea novaeangliae]|uniref:Uncharacterized protein n=1 Tax=Dufourea novaeangliae TaxID=178035 RepID=A0A154PFH3_DUFNO|nr:hypothetical protein WN55_01177 [Dufourea novaeangliae]